MPTVNRIPANAGASKNDLAAAAASLADEHGWCVFPVLPFDKVPAVEDWPSRNSGDPDYILREWPGPDHNIGIACGASGLLVADLDVKHRKDGIYDFEQIIGGGWPETYTVRTPSGGLHFYFRLPGDGWGNSRGTLPTSIDIRGSGGYVLGAGSVIATASYEVISGGTYEVISDAPVIPLPRVLAEMISTRKPVSSPVTTRSRWLRSPAAIQKAKEGLIQAVLDAPEGERNNILHWASCRAGEMVAAGEWDQEMAEAAMTAAGESAGLDDDEIDATVMSGLRTGAAA